MQLWRPEFELDGINKDISLIVRRRLYSSCVESSMLHGSETWPVRKENEVALQRAEMEKDCQACKLNREECHGS